MAKRPPTSTGGWDPSHTTLENIAKSCSNSLNELSTLANQRPGIRRSSDGETLKYLNKKIILIADFVTRFEGWRAEIGPAPFSSQKAVNLANTKLGRLKDKADEAREVLRARLGLYTLGLRLNVEKRMECEEKFDKHLESLNSTIGDLLASKTQLRDQAPRIHSNHEGPLHARFCEALKPYRHQQIDYLPLGQISVLWDSVQADKDLLKKVGNLSNPGDGIKYGPRVLDEAKTALQIMFNALCFTFGANRLVNGQKELRRFIDVFVIFRHLRNTYRKHFDAFLRHGNPKLPFGDNELKKIVGAEEPTFISFFLAEQHRVVKREWPEDPSAWATLDAKEPLPFRVTKNPNPQEGGFGLVYEVTNVFTQEILIHKMQKDDSDYLQSHFVEEIKTLKKLIGVRHIVQLKHSYVRNGKYGILLQPGEENLFDFLRRISSDWSRSQGFSDQEFPILSSFGCLCLSLAKIHKRSIKHKDIKPRNIVHDHGSNGVHDFFYIDFSVAHDFDNEENSRSQFQEQYSSDYAAPEVMKRAEEKERQKSKPVIVTVTDVGRSADVFSLGVVLLEILSVLLGEPYHQPIPNSFWSCKKFHEHLPELQRWISTQIERLESKNYRKELVPILKICNVMIARDPKERYSAMQAALKIAEAGNWFYCPECLDDVARIRNSASVAEDDL